MCEFYSDNKLKQNDWVMQNYKAPQSEYSAVWTKEE